MDLETKDGGVLISSEEYKKVIKFIDLYNKYFDTTYVIGNRQLNTLRKLGGQLVKPTIIK